MRTIGETLVLPASSHLIAYEHVSLRTHWEKRGAENGFRTDPRFEGIEPFQSKVWLSSPTMHGDEQRWVDEAIQTNWVSTVGANINEVEKQAAEIVGIDHAVALSCGTAALHLAIKLAGEKLYGTPRVGHGTMEGHKVMTILERSVLGARKLLKS